MEKMTYGEQLKHPNWQRKRLEMLSEANFECSNCGDKETTLHVHHRQYFKGRMAWEYDSTELAVLCENCHQAEHDTGDNLKKLLAELGPSDIFALAAGFNHHTDWIDRANVYAGREANALAYAAGFVAWMTYQLEIGDMDKVAAFAASLMRENCEARLVYEHNSAPIFGRDE